MQILLQCCYSSAQLFCSQPMKSSKMRPVLFWMPITDMAEEFAGKNGMTAGKNEMTSSFY